MVKKIPLTHGKYALVDDNEYNKLKHYTWGIVKLPGRTYAKTHINRKGVYMHRLIMDPPKGKVVDHINHNPLDNRKSNLRIVTQRQNSQNLKKEGSSKFPGVSKHPRGWQAHIMINGKQNHLGIFQDEREAAKTYEKACRELIGEELVCKAHKKNK